MSEILGAVGCHLRRNGSWQKTLLLRTCCYKQAGANSILILRLGMKSYCMLLAGVEPPSATMRMLALAVADGVGNSRPRRDR